MKENFEFSRYADHDLFHIRYGKGAVIIAIKKGSEKKKIIDGDYPPIHIARIFNTRDQKLNSSYPRPHLDPVKYIEEGDGFVRIEIEFVRRFEGNPDYRPLISVVERVIPATQITFEVIK